MTNFAAKTKNAETDSAKSNGLKQKSNELQAASMNTSAPLFAFPIQRKAACACGGGCPNCQTKSNLSISHPDDEYEKEADAIANKVMRMPNHSVGNEKVQLKPVSFSQLQPRCITCGDEEKMQRKESGSAGGMAAPSIVSDVISSSGKSLDEETRQFMESRMGRDFSKVQVHIDICRARPNAACVAPTYAGGKPFPSMSSTLRSLSA